MTCRETQEFITALIDQELDQPDRLRVEEHLNECPACRIAFHEERVLKERIRAAGERVHAPDHLRSRVFSDNRIFAAKNGSTRKWLGGLTLRSPLIRVAIAAALLLPLILPVYYVWHQTNEPVVLSALETYERAARGELPDLKRGTGDEIVRELTRAVGARFHPMAYDLTAMNLWPVAGLVREVNGRKILVAIYQGPGGLLICYTFLGSEEDAPPNAARFFDRDKKMNFYAFSDGKINAVLHRESDVICVLASEMSMDDLLTLTRSKAKPS
jgi:Putative zinc-finger